MNVPDATLVIRNIENNQEPGSILKKWSEKVELIVGVIYPVMNHLKKVDFWEYFQGCSNATNENKWIKVFKVRL